MLVFAGDTAGKISVWDITDHLLDYVRDEEADDEDTRAHWQDADVSVPHHTGGPSCGSLLSKGRGEKQLLLHNCR